MTTGIAMLLGKTLISVRRMDDEEIIFTTTDGETYKMFHSQVCCESVTIDDVELVTP